jgi:hypothetical protein
MNELRRAITHTCRAAAGEDSCRQVLSREVAQPLAIDQRLLPSFFVIGPPRTGSTWLHEVLSPHAVLPSPSKETRFFDNHFHRGLKWYVAHYGSSDRERRIGEVAPTYFASAAARERMAQIVPEAKIICVFRNPVDRVVSLYRLKRAYGLIPWSLEQAIERDPELMESSKYASTLKLWQRSFGTEKVIATVYDDLQNDPQAFVNSLANFIGVRPFKLQDWQYGFVHDSEHMTHPRSYCGTRTATMLADWFKARRLDRFVSAVKGSRLRSLVLGGGPPFPRLSEELLAWLHEKFKSEVEELEEVIQRDLSSWKVRNAV